MFWEKEVARQYGLSIESISPTRGIYIIRTDKGIKCLKRLYYGAQKLLFIHGAKEHLINNGFCNIDRLILTSDGAPYVEYGDDLYVITEWVDGRESDFRNYEEVLKAASVLSKLHEASKGYDIIEGSKLKSDLGRWKHLMIKRKDSLKKMKMIAECKLDKSEFDRLYIENVEIYISFANEAIDILNKSKYEDVVKRTVQEKSFCHHDYTYHNILIDKKDNYHVIDFDYCKYELRIYDFVNFLIKVLKRNMWDFNLAVNLINEYSKISPIYEDEKLIMFSLLKFPQRYWRLANRYYYNEANWPDNTFIRKIKEIIEERDSYMNFIGLFEDKYILNRNL